MRLGDNAATYGVGPRKMTDGYAYIMPMRGYVNLGFIIRRRCWRIPKRLLEGTGKGCVTQRLRALAEADRPRSGAGGSGTRPATPLTTPTLELHAECEPR